MRMLLKLSLTQKPLAKTSAAARESRQSIGCKKPSNWKPSTSSVRTDSARSLLSSTWRTRRKYRWLLNPSIRARRQRSR